MNVFYNTIVFVKDMAKTRKFYENILGLKIEIDYKVLVIYENRLAIHDGNALKKTIFKRIWNIFPPNKFGRKNIEIYIETNELKEMEAKLHNCNVRFIHKIEKQAWGQHVLRCYDPDNHIVEIGEPLHLEYLK